MSGVTAILQARMGSSRLPGKVVKEVLGKPLIAYEIDRLRLCSEIGEIILATSDMESDDPIAAVGDSLGVKVFRGSEADVLDRYYQASKLAKYPNIMRATGDCPLIDPAICNAAISTFFEEKADYVITSPKVAEGLDCEVMTKDALEAAWREAELPSEREHVTLFIRNRADRFKCVELGSDEDNSNYRITVDEPVDFTVVEAILKALIPKHGLTFSFNDVRDFLDTNPDILGLNSTIIRNEGLIKSLKEEA